MAEKTNANIGFEKQIWDAACVLWGHIPAAEYRKVIVGLIFLRYISCAFDKKYQELVAEGDGFEDDKDAYTMDNIFFVPEKARWSKIAESAHLSEIGTVIDNAMRAIEEENKSLKDVLPKNYASPDLDKRVLGDVVDIFTNNIDMSETGQDEDLFGRTYEYCIAMFAEKEGQKGGEFYTPSSVVKTLVEILKPFENCRVSGCSFAGADLTDWAVRGGTLEYCVLDHCPLKKQDFSGISLRGTSFTEADLEKANLSGCDLTETVFRNAQLKECDLRRAKFSRTDIRFAKMQKTKIDLEGAVYLAGLLGAVIN